MTLMPSMKRAVTIPEILRSAGYFTAMSGKWHLSKEPTDFGFDRVDQELGRIVSDLKKAGELDNTLILFFSDNGACPYDRNNTSRRQR